MTPMMWLRIGLVIAKLMWKFRGPVWQTAKKSYNAVEKWSEVWKNAGYSVTSDEKRDRAIRRFLAVAPEGRKVGDGAKAADAIEAVWTSRNPRKAAKRQFPGPARFGG